MSRLISAVRPAPRVVQWSTGTIGSRSLHTVWGSNLPACTSGQAKVGSDAGALCGLPGTGIRATNQIDDVLSSGADYGITISGHRIGAALLRFQAIGYCTRELDRDWNPQDTGWHISVLGDAPLKVNLHLPVPLDRMAEVSPVYTPNRAVNAVPYVCAAAPGIATSPARCSPRITSILAPAS
jgi:hypothetical protein